MRLSTNAGGKSQGPNAPDEKAGMTVHERNIRMNKADPEDEINQQNSRRVPVSGTGFISGSRRSYTA